MHKWALPTVRSGQCPGCPFGTSLRSNFIFFVILFWVWRIFVGVTFLSIFCFCPQCSCNHRLWSFQYTYFHFSIPSSFASWNVFSNASTLLKGKPLHWPQKQRDMQNVNCANDLEAPVQDKKKYHSCTQCSYTSRRLTHMKNHMLVHRSKVLKYHELCL